MSVISEIKECMDDIRALIGNIESNITEISEHLETLKETEASINNGTFDNRTKEKLLTQVELVRRKCILQLRDYNQCLIRAKEQEERLKGLALSHSKMITEICRMM